MKRRLFLIGGLAGLAGCGGGSRPYSAGLVGGVGATPSPTPSPTPGATPTGDFAVEYRLTRNRWPDTILYVVKVTGKPGFTTPVTVNKVEMIPSVAGTEREFSLLPFPDDIANSVLQPVPLWVTGTTADGKAAESHKAFLDTATPGIAAVERNDGLTIYKTQIYDLTIGSRDWEGTLSLTLDRNPPEIKENDGITIKKTVPLPAGATLDGIPATVTLTKGDAGTNGKKFPITLTLPDGTPEGKLYRFRIRAIDAGSGKSVSTTVAKQYGAIPSLVASATYKSATASGALVYELALTPFFGFNLKVTGLKASAGPTTGLPAGTTYAVTPNALDFSSGSSATQTATLTMQLGGTPQGGLPSVRLDATLSDGTSFSQTIFINLPA